MRRVAASSRKPSFPRHALPDPVIAEVVRRAACGDDNRRSASNCLEDRQVESFGTVAGNVGIRRAIHETKDLARQIAVREGDRIHDVAIDQPRLLRGKLGDRLVTRTFVDVVLILHQQPYVAVPLSQMREGAQEHVETLVPEGRRDREEEDLVVLDAERAATELALGRTDRGEARRVDPQGNDVDCLTRKAPVGDPLRRPGAGGLDQVFVPREGREVDFVTIGEMLEGQPGLRDHEGDRPATIIGRDREEGRADPVHAIDLGGAWIAKGVDGGLLPRGKPRRVCRSAPFASGEGNVAMVKLEAFVLEQFEQLVLVHQREGVVDPAPPFDEHAQPFQMRRHGVSPSLSSSRNRRGSDALTVSDSEAVVLTPCQPCRGHCLQTRGGPSGMAPRHDAALSCRLDPDCPFSLNSGAIKPCPAFSPTCRR